MAALLKSCLFGGITMKIIILLILYLFYAIYTSYTDIKEKEVSCINNYIFLLCSILLTPFLGNTFNVILTFIYSLIIFIIFKIFKVGDGDTEIFISLFPLLLYLSKYNVNKLTELILLQLILSSVFALTSQLILKIKEILNKNNEKKINFTSEFAFAPYIFLSMSVIILKMLF